MAGDSKAAFSILLTGTGLDIFSQMKRPPVAFYHYCSTESFHRIVEGKCIAVSFLSMSNDSREGAIAREILDRYFDAGFEKFAHRVFLKGAVENWLRTYRELGFCLSEVEDLLSQWRGYAADGAGVSIGFSREYLLQICEEDKTGNTRLERIIYDPKAQERMGKSAIHRISPHLKKIEADTPRDKELEEAYRLAYRELQSFMPKLFTFKPPGFGEEREWRLLNSYRSGTPCLFRSNQNKIIPYRKIELIRTKLKSIITVMLGPKHPTPPAVVEEFLESHGFGAKVARSRISYR